MVDATPKLDVLDMSVRSFDEPFIPDASTATSPSSDPLYSKRPPPSRTRSASKRTKITVVFDPSKSIFSNAKASSVQFLQSLLDSPKVDILNKETVEVYIKGVSLDMLKYFCGRAIIDSLLYSNTIRVPPTHASRDGIIGVIRYMRRCCQGSSRRPTGELRTPQASKKASLLPSHVASFISMPMPNTWRSLWCRTSQVVRASSLRMRMWSSSGAGTRRH